MGVSGTGKSTVAAALAERLGWELVEGDDLHPRRNVEKMAAGEPLTDADRAPWLALVQQRAVQLSDGGRGAVVTCSALKRSYRDSLRAGATPMFFVHLAGEADTLTRRMGRREGHFMPAGLLRSQLDTLEPLEPDEDGVVLDVAGTVEEVVAVARAAVEARLHAEDPTAPRPLSPQGRPSRRRRS